MSYQKAELDTENGSQLLRAGTRYFIDTLEKDIFQTTPYGGTAGVVLEDIAVLIPQGDWGNTLRSGRGHIMLSFSPKKDIIIPSAIGGKTGYFYVQPDDESLSSIQRDIYGDTYEEPRGIWELLANTQPQLLKHLIDGGVFVQETTEELTSNSKELTKMIVIAAASIAGLMLLYRMGSKSS